MLRNILSIFLLSVFITFTSEASTKSRDRKKNLVKEKKWGIVIHGGYGGISTLTPEKRALYIKDLNEALNKGYEILAKGGSAVEAVSAAVVCLENSPLFNAGKGSVLNNRGKVVTDASIMNGLDLQAGSVSAVEFVKNPILLAKEVLYNSPHVMLVGEGAYEFAKFRNLELKPATYFLTDARIKEFEKIQEKILLEGEEHKAGTVGAVAVDKNGNLAAATSTGGLVNKEFGRVGDSSIIGAGTYAKNKVGAISTTGTGEVFIRLVVAHSILSRVEELKETLQIAGDKIMKRVKNLGGRGGMIGIDFHGNPVFSIQTANGMYRGYKISDGRTFVGIEK